MSGRQPEHRVRPAVSLQTWADLTFLHWPVPVAEVAAVLPPGLTVDVIAGSAWLGVTPFRMCGVRVPGLPPVPGWSTFAECNVRTYVRGPDGRDGLWFLRLVCPRRLVVGGLRLAGLPYVRASAAADVRAGALDYRYARVGDAADGRLEVRVRTGPALDDDERTPLVDALTGRWNAFTVVAGRLLRVPVAHGPWPLHRATADLRVLPPDAAGVRLPSVPPLVHASPGVASRIGLPRPAA